MGEPEAAPPFVQPVLFLEADRRRERDAKVVVRATVEIHFIARFEAESDWSDECLNAAAGIRREVRTRVAELVERTGERIGGSGAVAGAELKESNFSRYERAEWPRRFELKFRS